MTGTTQVAAPRLLQRQHLPLVLGAVTLITVAAFENRATTSVMPTVARELDGLALFGAATAAPLISSVVAIVLAGLWADRRGPVPALLTGIGVFAVAQLAMALSPHMVVFVAGRLAAGVAEGLVDIALTVLVARVLPPVLRPRLFAAFSAAWVLPSLVGPPVGGVIAELAGWRWVFAVAVVLVLPVAIALQPAMRRARRPVADDEVEQPPGGLLRAAVVVAVGLALLTAGGAVLPDGTGAALAGAAGLLAGVALVVAGARRVLPVGTVRLAAGLPAVVAARGLLAAAFGVGGAFIPLMLTVVHGFGPAAAGSSLMITGLSWAFGSQLNGLDRVQQRTGVVGRMRLAFGLIAVGVAGPALLAVELLPVWLGLALWAVGGIGMGLGSPTLNNQVLVVAPPSEHGRASAASLLAMTVAQAVLIALAGAAIAVAPYPLPGAVLAVVMLVSVAVALVGAASASRLETR